MDCHHFPDSHFSGKKGVYSFPCKVYCTTFFVGWQVKILIDERRCPICRSKYCGRSADLPRRSWPTELMLPRRPSVCGSPGSPVRCGSTGWPCARLWPARRRS
nr:MAG TPA: hypothetical protein [Caudoviricetes sp.]